MSPFIGIAALLRRRYVKSRLQRMQDQLAIRPLSQFTLTQWPLKSIFTIFLLFLSALLFRLFSQHQTHALTAEYSLKQAIYSLQTALFQPTNVCLDSHFKAKTQLNAFYNAILVIQIFIGVAIVGIVITIKIKKVNVKRGQKAISFIQYSVWGIVKYKQDINAECKMQIHQEGNQRFTQSDYKYVVRMLTMQRNIIVLERGNIFQARKSLLILSHILRLPYDRIIYKGIRNDKL